MIEYGDEGCKRYERDEKKNGKHDLDPWTIFYYIRYTRLYACIITYLDHFLSLDYSLSQPNLKRKVGREEEKKERGKKE